MPSVFGYIARNKFVFLILLSTIFILGGMYFLNNTVLAIRMLELQGFLKEINRETSQVDELGMVSKYKLHLQLYNDKIDEKKFDDEELKTVYLATSFEVQTKTPVSEYGGISAPVVWIMNVFRMLLGKSPIQASMENPSDTELTLAYYFERNKHFRKALSIYDGAISGKKIAENKLPIVLLHQGYCRSLIGEYNNAKSIFISIIKNYNNENVAITAALLLQYLETLQSEINKVKESDESDILKSRKFYRLIAYKDAVDVLEKIVPQNKKEADQIAYLNARCLEETGKMEESAKLYQKIIQNDHESDLAKMANRRLLVMASVDDEAKKLKELAIKNNEVIKDNGFDEMAETSDKVDENREQLDTNAKKRIAFELKKESNLSSASAQTLNSEGTVDSEEFSKFIDDSIIAIEGKSGTNNNSQVMKTEPIETPALLPEGTAAPYLSAEPTPTPEPTAKQLIEPSTTKEMPINLASSPEPGKPYTANYKDAKGNIYKMEAYDANGNLEKTIIYEYDNKGNAILIKVYDKNGKPIENY